MVNCTAVFAVIKIVRRVGKHHRCSLTSCQSRNPPTAWTDLPLESPLWRRPWGGKSSHRPHPPQSQSSAPPRGPPPCRRLQSHSLPWWRQAAVDGGMLGRGPGVITSPAGKLGVRLLEAPSWKRGHWQYVQEGPLDRATRCSAAVR